MKALVDICFHAFEAFGFLLPAFPETKEMRLFVLLVYWVGHAMGLQRKGSFAPRGAPSYLRLKRAVLLLSDAH
jgi:hypothetical protein